MGIPLPDPVEVCEWPDGVSYVLPRRQLGRMQRWRAWLQTFVSLGGVGMLGAVTVHQVAPLFAGPAGPFDVLAVLWALKFTPFILLLGASTLFGLTILFGHLEIEMRDEQLCALECAGPFRWPRSQAIARISALAIYGYRQRKDEGGRASINTFATLQAEFATKERPSGARILLHPFHLPRYYFMGWLMVFVNSPEDRALLIARCENGPALLLAGGYPRDWVTAIAYDLSRRWPAARRAMGLNAGKAGLPVIECAIEDLERADLPVQPPGSQALLEPNSDGLMLTLPPRGLRRCPLGIMLLVFGLFFVLFFGLAVIALVSELVANGDLWLLIPLPLILAFAGAGAVCVLKGLDMGRCHGRVAVVGDELLIMQVGILGARQYEWRREDLAAINAYSSDDMGLRIVPRSGKAIGLFLGRDAHELWWIATLLREALRVPARRERTSP